MSERLAVCAKSPWIPTIRREHALALEASSHGVETTFVEAPSDVRAVNPKHSRPWIRGLGGVAAGLGGVDVIARSTLAPGHRHPTMAAVDNRLLQRVLRSRGDFDSVVVNVPWQWGAVSQLATHRVFDAADDWTALIPRRREALLECYARIAAEADSVIIANPALAGLFGARATHLIPNATESTMVEGAPARPPRSNRMVYVGTLSERFDADLVGDVLTALPEWSLDLYGECRYIGAGAMPGSSLERLLVRHSGRLRWQGVVDRSQLPQLIDAADVFVVPNVVDHSAGQSSMKAFDCAARGRPMVCTTWPSSAADTLPPHTYEATGSAEFVDAIRAAATEPAGYAQDRVTWAAGQTWESRWAGWAAAAGLRRQQNQHLEGLPV